jgi:hypothetical protein
VVEKKDSTGLEIVRNDRELLQSNIEQKNPIPFAGFNPKNPTPYKSESRQRSYSI